jgi:RNA recognition motif-containing protein
MAVSVVVRHTFLELEPAVIARPRALSDTALYLSSEDELSDSTEDCSQSSIRKNSDSEASDSTTCNQSDASNSESDSEREDSCATTVMLRNLPSSFSRAALLELLEGAGFAGAFDFVYLPVDFQSGASLGYAFVNLCTASDAKRLQSSLQGFASWGTGSNKVLEVCWSEPTQGLPALVERFRNSRVMHGMVPDDYKPAIFQHGQRVAFPKNTQRIRPPFQAASASVALAET